MTTLRGDDLELRPLPETDLPKLLMIYQGTPLYFDGLGFPAGALSLADVRAQWQAAQDGPGRALLGVYHVETNLLIGVADVQAGAPLPDAGAIWLLLIWGGFQRQGYGQECMALLEHWLVHEQGARSLWVVAVENEEGLSFLRRQGFQATGDQAAPPIGRGRAHWMRRE